ncbi:hypothetical protein BH24ACI3_BH24ACI3_02290 [soil metagenome]
MLSILTTMLLFSVGCKSSGNGFLGPVDETAEAGKMVQAANEDLTKIKVLYKENEGKREEIKLALESNDIPEVRRLAGEIVQLINEGTNFGNSAIDKIRDARDMKINPQYEDYLRLKEEALMKQLEAFNNYHQAARTLRDNYDPKNAEARDKVKADFEEKTLKYRETMEKARDFSSAANELYKETIVKK